MGHEPETPSQGLIRRYLDKNRADLHATYSKSFALYRRADQVLSEILNDLQMVEVKEDENTTIQRSCVLCLRFYKAMRAALLLIENDCLVDAFTCIRNMQECYLALAFLLKDEAQFMEVIEADLKTSREGIHKHLEVAKMLRHLTPEAKKTLHRQRKEFEATKAERKGISRADANSFYEQTKDSDDSAYIYFLYKYISNAYAHISSRSLSVNINKDNGELNYEGANAQDMNAFITYAINTFFVFCRLLDARFLGDRYKARLMEIQLDLADCIKSAV